MMDFYGPVNELNEIDTGHRARRQTVRIEHDDGDDDEVPQNVTSFYGRFKYSAAFLSSCGDGESTDFFTTEVELDRFT